MPISLVAVMPNCAAIRAYTWQRRKREGRIRKRSKSIRKKEKYENADHPFTRQ